MKKQGSGLGSVAEKSKAGAGPAVVVSSDTLSAADIAKRLKGWFPDLSDEVCEKAGAYHSELLKFNKTINLISPNTIKNADSVHVADSIFAARIIEKSALAGHPIYDFGSGNVFTGK